MAIMKDRKVSGKNKKDRFLQCLTIAKAQLSKYGYVVPTGDEPSSPIGLTAKGRVREAKHQSEGRAKTVLFDTLYDQFDLDGTKAGLAKKVAADLNAMETQTRTLKKDIIE
jgi:hypothetical protein